MNLGLLVGFSKVTDSLLQVINLFILFGLNLNQILVYLIFDVGGKLGVEVRLSQALVVGIVLLVPMLVIPLLQPVNKVFGDL